MRLASFATVLLLTACLDRFASNRSLPGYQMHGDRMDEFVTDVGDRVFFDFDSPSLDKEARVTLGRQVLYLLKYPTVKFQIAGNCDERGTEEYNLALGQRRANADRDYLASRGIAAGRIQTISYGKSRPVDPSSTPDAWAHNRNAITSVR